MDIDTQFLGKLGSIVGKVCGIASAVPGLGTTWIVELEDSLPNYPYRCIAVPEMALSPARERLYQRTGLAIQERVLNFLSHQDAPVPLSVLCEAMPDLVPGAIANCCDRLGNTGEINKVAYPRPNGGYISYFSVRS